MPVPSKNARPYLKNKAKWAEDVLEVVEYLPSKHETPIILGSKPQYYQNNNNKINRGLTRCNHLLKIQRERECVYMRKIRVSWNELSGAAEFRGQ
jgi:hypothetical protein